MSEADRLKEELICIALDLLLLNESNLTFRSSLLADIIDKAVDQAHADLTREAERNAQEAETVAYAIEGGNYL